ncbi:MAG: hypothetical protein ACYDAR_14255 [Thermomicrobiales bacterium]
MAQQTRASAQSRLILAVTALLVLTAAKGVLTRFGFTLATHPLVHEAVYTALVALAAMAHPGDLTKLVRDALAEGVREIATAELAPARPVVDPIQPGQPPPAPTQPNPVPAPSAMPDTLVPGTPSNPPIGFRGQRGYAEWPAMIAGALISLVCILFATCGCSGVPVWPADKCAIVTTDAGRVRQCTCGALTEVITPHATLPRPAGHVQWRCDDSKLPFTVDTQEVR